MAKKFKQPEGHAPGIYFNMPLDKYHSDPALSHSGMVKLLLSPLDYWITGPLNPDREEWQEPKRGSAMWFGKLCHMLLMERDLFWATHKVVGMVASHHNSFTWLTRDEYREIKACVDEIRNMPDAAEFFTRGYAEVSIFWRDKETGLMMRIRVDYLRVFGGLDYKRAKSILSNQLGWQIADFGYDIQDRHYQEGIRQIKILLSQGKAVIEGTVDQAWLKQFMADPRHMFRFFFQRSIAPHIFRIVGFDSDISSNAQARVDDAKHIYKQHIEKYGSERWPAGKVQPEEFSIYHMPKRIFD